MKHAELIVRFARRIPDPTNELGERHIFICPIETLPAELPKDPNPREQDVDRGIWKEIRRHLLNEEGTPNTFHLKNKGITIVASKVTKLSEDRYQLSFAKGDGILDGGHTYELIIDTQDEIRALNESNQEDPIQQFVKVEVLSGVDRSCLSEIAGGLNTAIQVQKMSLENLKGRFEWIKDELALEPYISEIAFKENEGDTSMDIRDIIVLLDLFNIYSFPNDGGEHPVRAYTSKAGVLDYYVKTTSEYERLRPILKDILKLYDIIRSEAPSLHNDAGGKAGKLVFVESRARGMYTFPFKSKGGKIEEGKSRLTTSAAYPMLAAFRWCVEQNPKTDKARWIMAFKDIVSLWRESAAELMKATQATSVANGRKANAIGRNIMHWGNLHNIVAKRSLMMTRAAS